MEIIPVDNHSLAARELGVAIVKKLDKHYPRHDWRVFLDEEGGVVNIICDTVSSPLKTHFDYAYVLHLKTVFADPDLKCIMRAGGEILERANLHRRMYNGDKVKRVEGVKEKHQPISS